MWYTIPFGDNVESVDDSFGVGGVCGMFGGVGGVCGMFGGVAFQLG